MGAKRKLLFPSNFDRECKIYTASTTKVPPRSMGSALCNWDEEFFQVVLSHWGDACITLELCQRMRLVSRGACQAVANTRPGVRVKIRPTRDVLRACLRRVHTVSSWASIVRVDVMPLYTTSMDDGDLCRVLQACDVLEHLNLRSAVLRGKALARVLGAANTHQTLQHVNLTGALHGTEGCDSLLPVLPGLGNLRVLSLAENCLYGSKGNALGRALRLCPCLEDLDLTANGLGDEKCGEVLKVLKGATALERLVLSINFLEHASASELGELMVWSKSLRHLDLSNNRMGDAGAKTLATRLGSTARLETLVLSSNGIHDLGAEALAKGLRESTTLRCLDVRYNQIGNDGVQALERVEGMCTVQVQGNHYTASTRLSVAPGGGLLWTGIDDVRDEDSRFQYVFSTLQ